MILHHSIWCIIMSYQLLSSCIMFWNSYIYIYLYGVYIYGVCIYIWCIYMVCIYIWCVYIYMVYIYMVYIYMYGVYVYIYMYGVYIYAWCIYIYGVYIYIHTCLRHIQYLKPPKPFFADRFYFSRGWFHQAPKRKIDFAGNSSCQNQTPHPHIAGIIYPGTYMATRFICSDSNI